MFSITSTTSIKDIPPDQWEGLSAGVPIYSWKWLRLLEETSVSGQHHQYFLAWQDGQLIGTLPYQIQIRNKTFISLDYVLFGRFHRLITLSGLSSLPAIVCGNSKWHRLLYHPKFDVEHTDSIRHELLDAVFSESRRRGMSLCFRNLAGNQHEMTKSLNQRDGLSTEDTPDNTMNIVWLTFQDYLKQLKSTHPGAEKSIRNEINRLKRAQIVISPIDHPQQWAERLHAVMNEHCLRLNRVPFPFGVDFFKGLKDALGDNVTIYAATLNDMLLGALIMIRNERTAYLHMIGISNRANPKHAVYFNLAFNRPLQDAIHDQLNVLNFGKLLYTMKSRRGCRINPEKLFLWPRTRIHRYGLTPLMHLHTTRIRQMTADIPLNHQNSNFETPKGGT